MGNQGQHQGHAITDGLQSRVPGWPCLSGLPGALLPHLQPGVPSFPLLSTPSGHTLGIIEAEVPLRNSQERSAGLQEGISERE